MDAKSTMAVILSNSTVDIEYSKIISWNWNINEKSNIDPIQNLILRKNNILFCYHFVLKIIMPKCLPSRARQSRSLTLNFSSACQIIASGIAMVLWQNLPIFQLAMVKTDTRYLLRK